MVRGKYLIVRKLGQGGMGVVYEAEHQMLGGHVALKFLAPELSRNPQFVKRFRNEARAAYQLRHPNIVEVTDLDQDEDGSLFIAMEYVNGPSLRMLLREAKVPLPVDRALGIARGIASGLVAAHERGAVHRDIKPENILLSVDAKRRVEAKVLDFGIAAMTENITDLSRTRGLLLTPEYASPEQWRGTPGNELDGRTDLYALGGCLYEMLIGRTPYRATNPEGWMYQHLNGTIEPISTLRPEVQRDYPGLEPIVMSLLARDRDHRIPSAIAFLEAIANFAPDAQAHYVQSANLPPIQTGTIAAKSPESVRQQTNTPSALHDVNTPAGSQQARVDTPVAAPWNSAPPPGMTEVSTPVAITPDGNARFTGTAAARQAGVPTLAEALAPHKNKLLLIVGGGVLACVAGFFAVWLVFHSQPTTLPAAETPKLTPPGGHYNSPQAVTITDATPNAVIHYTVDGTPPNQASPIYAQPLDSLTNGAVLRASATAPGHKQSSSIIGVYTWPDSAGETGQNESARSQRQTPDVYEQAKRAYDHKEYEPARVLFKQSCDGGNTAGCNYLGYLLSQGLGGATDTITAQGIFTKACDGGNVSSCASLGSLFQNAGDIANARKYFQIACDRHFAQGCELLRNVR